jgi:hypothetical protein
MVSINSLLQNAQKGVHLVDDLSKMSAMGDNTTRQ